MNISRKEKLKGKATDRRSGKDRRVADDNIMDGTDQRKFKERRKRKAEKHQPK